MYGWMGTILKVDLTREKIFKEPLDRDLAANFLGGRGINSKILYDEVKPGIDPLSPDNVLIFGAGLLSGTIAPSCGRLTITAKSPLTGIHGDANSGGHFAPEMKFAGYDHIVFYGKAERPVYLWVDDDDIQLRDAHQLWGGDTWETTKAICKEVGDPEVQVACIGPAGESLVKFACVINSLTRANGRTGMGAVMGSKNLKAVAVRGTKAIEVARPDEFERACYEALDKIKAAPFYKVISVLGTPLLIRTTNATGRLITMNGQRGEFEEGVENLAGEAFLEKYVVKSKGCFGCPTHCSHFYAVEEGPYAGTREEGAEFDGGIASFGSRCGNSDLAACLRANHLCNRLGMDTICCGGTIAFLMECWQRGVITEKDTGGIALEWGNADAIVELVEMTAFRKGLGGIVAEGTARAAKRIGKGSERWAITIKGMTPNNGDYRATKGGAFAQCVSTRGSDHLRASPLVEYMRLTPEKTEMIFAERIGTTEGARALHSPRAYDGKASVVAWLENLLAAEDALGICKFNTWWWSLDMLGPVDLAKMASAATGTHIDEKGLMKIGERIYNIERCFLVREGITRKDDYPPRRWVEEPSPTGPAKGELIDPKRFEQMLDEYYAFHGWDKNTGVPTREKLEELGLKYIANELEKMGRLPPRAEEK